MERLQKVIANAGYTSRRKAEELIEKGKVEVDGKVVTELGAKVGENAKITVEGNELLDEKKVYYLLYKPEGIISSSKDEKGRKTVVDLIPEKRRIYPVGRLDYDTSGIILLTNDGDLTNELIHPKSDIKKKYVAKIEGIISGYSIKQLREGITIDGKKTSPATVKLKTVNKENKTCIVEVTIHEGFNHQVKKMFEHFGHQVIKLKRETFAGLDLNGMKKGEYRVLNPKEVKVLYSQIKK